MPFLLLLLFNGLVLFLSAVLFLDFFKPTRVTHFDVFLCGGIAFVVVCGLAFLFDSPLGQWFLRLLSGARRTVEREQRRLNPTIDRVQLSIQKTHGLMPLKKLRVMVIDEPTPNAFAIGKYNLILSRGLYETATEEELAGVIAHEFGHLQNGDSQKLGIALGVSTVTLIISFLASGVVALTSLINRLSTIHAGGVILLIASSVIMLFTYFFLAFVWLGDGMLRLAMLFVGRKQEYRADKFAIQAGFGAGLLSFLDKVKNFEWTSKKSFLTKLYDTHPPIMLRIGEIEKGLG